MGGWASCLPSSRSPRPPTIPFSPSRPASQGTCAQIAGIVAGKRQGRNAGGQAGGQAGRRGRRTEYSKTTESSPRVTLVPTAPLISGATWASHS